jgi:glycosyltransferase involved in cell wall biosynthesis
MTKNFRFESLEGKTALVVASDWLWPCNYAARIDVMDRICSLHSLGITVDLLVTAGKHDLNVEVDELSHFIRSIKAIQRKTGFFDMLGLSRPGQVHSRKGLSKIDIANEYDFMILEGHYVGEVIKNDTVSAAHTILRINNDERTYFWQLAKSRISLSSIYYLLEAVRFWAYQTFLMREIPLWMISSEKEHDKFKALASEVRAKSIFLPPNVDIKTSPVVNEDKNVLFIGTLLMPNNFGAVQWYLKFVHPLLCDIPNYQFIIAGNTGNSDESAEFEGYFSTFDKVMLVKNPATTESLYQQGTVFVNPMLYGAGIKLKTVHALAAGLPVVSSSVGNEGTCMRDGIEIYERDTSEGFAEAVRSLLCDSAERLNVSGNALKRLSQIYDQRLSLGNFLTDLLVND